MHEASLMRNLMAKIEEIAEAEGASVVRVSVWLGALSHMSAEHFAEHFETSAAGTCAEGATLAVTVSDDIGDAHAQDVLLESVELDS